MGFDQMGISAFLFGVIIVWSLSWKLFALWKAAKKNSPAWFVILALVNTIGVLEILYIYIFSEMKHRVKREKPLHRAKARRKRR